MQITPAAVTLVEVVNQFQLWRDSKNSKFPPIPVHLRDHIRQLLGSYQVPQIAAALNISKATIYSIKKDQNSHILAESTDDAEHNLSFIPFKLIDTTESAPTPVIHCCTCQIIKPNGAKLIINTSDPTNVIKAFLCCN